MGRVGRWLKRTAKKIGGGVKKVVKGAWNVAKKIAKPALKVVSKADQIRRFVAHESEAAVHTVHFR